MKPLSRDPARLNGMSERMIVSHYENNYGGAVRRLNLIEEKLAEHGGATTAAPHFEAHNAKAPSGDIAKARLMSLTGQGLC